MSYKIIFDGTLFPIVEIDCRDLLKFSVIDLAHMVNDIKTQLIAREKETDSAVQEEVGWFLRNVVEEDKIDKWSEMDNSVYPLSHTGAYPPPMTLDSDGRFVLHKGPDRESTDEEIIKWLDMLLDSGKGNAGEIFIHIEGKGFGSKKRGDTTFQVEGAPLTEDQLARECLRHWRMKVKLDRMRLSGNSHEEMKDLAHEAHFLHEALWDQLEQEK